MIKKNFLRDRLRTVGLLAGTVMTAALAVPAMAEVAPITIVINQSPWFPGFESVVELYEETTGNTVELDVNPFAGSLEKQRAAVRTDESPFDLLVMNAGFFVEFYKGGFMEPLQDIDPGFKLSKDIYDFDESVCWDATAEAVTCGGDGKLTGIPINPNLLLLHYRADLYDQKGLEVPKTWEELSVSAEMLNDQPKTYGISQIGQRGAFAVTYAVFPYIWSFGGDIFKDQKAADFTITINSPETLAGMETYIKLATDFGHPSTAGQTMTNMIQNMATGKAAHVISVMSPGLFDDANQSAVVGKVNYAATPASSSFPGATPLGHWLAGVPKNVPDERKLAALAFLEWFQTSEAQEAYARAGSAPVSRAVLEGPMSEAEEFRWMKPLAEAIPTARLTFLIPEASQVLAVTELRLNQAIGGQLELKDALNTAAKEISEIMINAGYDAPTLPDLK